MGSIVGIFESSFFDFLGNSLKYKEKLYFIRYMQFTGF